MQNHSKGGDKASFGGRCGVIYGVSFAGKHPQMVGVEALRMKMYITLVTIIIATFGTVSGAVIRTLPEMEFIKQETARLLDKSLWELTEITI